MRLDIVSKTARMATQFSSQLHTNQLHVAHVSATLRSFLAVKANQTSQRTGRFGSLMPMVAAVAVMGAAGVINMDDNNNLTAECEAGAAKPVSREAVSTLR